MTYLLSHVKWFVEESTIEQVLPSFSDWLTIIIIVALGIFVVKIIDQVIKDRKFDVLIDKKLSGLKQWAPLVVRLSTALLLLVNVWQGYLLAPNIEQTISYTTTVIISLQIIAAILLFLGMFNKTSSILLVFLYILVIRESSFINVLDHLEYIGLACYLWLRGPGSYSLQARISKKGLKVTNSSKWSLSLFRIGVGLALVVLALSEKLLNIGVAEAFLSINDWNILSSFGISNYMFVILAGSIELLVGLALILNLAPRLITLVVLSLMIITASLLGIEEIFGHLFAIGFVFAIWVNDKKPAKLDPKPNWFN